MEQFVLFIAILFSICLNIMTQSSKKIKSREEIKAIEIIENPISNQNNQVIKLADILKSKVCEIYESEAENKRERIVRLLIQLERLEDIDEFFEERDYIRSYIFNIYQN